VNSKHWMLEKWLELPENKERYEEYLRLGREYPGIFAEDEIWTVGKGWWPLVEKICKSIQSHFPGVQIIQYKEKFGALRCYITPSSDILQGFVWTIEKESQDICEECGQPGFPRQAAWIKTLCKDHAYINPKLDGTPAKFYFSSLKYPGWIEMWQEEQRARNSQ
jgi:hypothetical protein